MKDFDIESMLHNNISLIFIHARLNDTQDASVMNNMY